MIRRFFLPLLAALALAFPEGSQAADKWLQIRSKNFLLVGNASESTMRRVGRNLEEFRAAIATLYPSIGEEAPIGTTVVVFKNDQSFRPFKPLYEGKPASISGYFVGGSDVNFIALSADTDSEQVIYHEFLHNMTRDTGPPLPPWASEGIAELYSTFKIASNGKEMILGIPVTHHVLALRERQLMPLSTFFGVDHDSSEYNEASKKGIFYAQSWAAVHYFMMSDQGRRRPQFSKYIQLVEGGKSVDESFREAFQTDYPAFEKELYSYIRSRMTWPALQFKLQSKLDFSREMQVTPLAEAQTEYYLGDLMLHMNRLDTAETQLQKAISMDAKFAGSYASMGLLKLRQERQQEALEFLTRAVEADSQNHMAHYYYAYMLQKLHENEDAGERESRMRLMRTHLKKSVELAPRYVEAYNLLGYVAAVLEDELDETEKLLKTAIAIAPGRQDLQLQLFQLMIRNNKAVAARVLLTQLKAVAANDDIRGRADQMLENVAAKLKYEQDVREYEEQKQLYETARAAREAEARTIERTTNERPTITRNTPPPSTADPSSETPQPVRPRRPSGLQIEGYLTLIDCTRGATFRLRVGNGVFEFHSDDPAKIEFTSYVAKVSASISCGAVKPELPVRIIYRRVQDGRFLGEPVLVEFIEKI